MTTHYTLRLRLEAYHQPTERWHVYETTHGLRAVSRSQAITKGVRIVEHWPGYQDREGHADWPIVTANAEIIDSSE